MVKRKQNILVTLPSLKDQGGVAGYYNSILPQMVNNEYKVSTLEIGSTARQGNYLYPVIDQIRFRRLITSQQYDLVHVNPSLNAKSFFRDGLFILQAKRKGLLVLVFFHGWEKAYGEAVKKKLQWFFNRTYGQADATIVLANDFKQNLMQWGVTQPIYKETTTVDESLLKQFSISNKLNQIENANEIRILYLARLERQKGVFESVDAVSILIQKGWPVSLSIAGDGVVGDELRRYVEKLGFSDNSIRFLGDVRDIKKISAFADHHIYCFPTAYGEGLPISVLEAMAFGMPVITRPVGGLVDIFENGRMGFLCKGRTSDEIASAIEKIISDKSLFLKMSEYNYLYAKKHFIASVVAERLSAIYQKTLETTGSRLPISGDIGIPIKQGNGGKVNCTYHGQRD